MPNNNTTARGRPAISPQSVTGLRARLQAAMTLASTRNTAGLSGWQRWLTRGLSRSAAMRYWTRSLEPIETKSTISIIDSIITAAAGTSSIETNGHIATGTVLLARSRLARSTMLRTLRISSRVVIMGNISRTRFFGPAAARRTARICVAKNSGCSNDKRMERQPRNGLASRAMAEVGDGFVAAQIQRADGDAVVRAGSDDFFVGGGLFFFIGDVGMREKQILGAK